MSRLLDMLLREDNTNYFGDKAQLDTYAESRVGDTVSFDIYDKKINGVIRGMRYSITREDGVAKFIYDIELTDIIEVDLDDIYDILRGSGSMFVRDEGITSVLNPEGVNIAGTRYKRVGVVYALPEDNYNTYNDDTNSAIVPFEVHFEAIKND